MSMSNRLTGWLAGSTVTVAVVVLVALFPGEAEVKQHEQDVTAIQAPKEQPTVIEEGKVTAGQKEHGKLFKHSGRKLQDIAASRAGDVEVEEEAGYRILVAGPPRKVPVFLSAVCNADAVVIGTVRNKTSQLTNEGNFIFT